MSYGFFEIAVAVIGFVSIATYLSKNTLKREERLKLGFLVAVLLFFLITGVWQVLR